MNNRRSLKENLTISNKQRFSIRKFSIGVASVMLGTTLYFMGGVGPSIVHADSVQEQSVQTPKLDTNSAQASSDTSSAEQTSSQNQTSSAQNSQKAVSNASANTKSTDSKTQTSDQVANATTDKKSASQADNASATNSKTQDNKKVVSDANRAKSTANDAQTKSAQQTAKSDAANSNTLVVQQTKKLTGNAKLNKLVDSKAQTDTKTDSNYSVTDNYPEGLMNYLPSDFNNKQEYAFEWLRNKNKNNIILTTNRTGDGEVYVYLDGKKVGTLAQNSSQTLDVTRRDIWGYDHSKNIGTVYNDDYAGIVQSNGYLLNIIYSSHAKDVDNAGSSYSTVSFFVPHKITQTVTYKDSKGNVIDSLTHTQDGLTGQSYTTGLPSGSDYVRSGEYLDNITNNGSVLISEFHDGYTCTKDYHDGVSVTFTENDSEKTGTGTMDYVIYYGGEVVQRGSLAYGQSTNYTNDSGRYTIVNPYVPQTTNIVYQYKKLGNVVNIDPKGKTTTPYANDTNDPTKVEPINVPSIPGYTTLVNGKTVSDKTIMPADPGQDTTITYLAHAQKASVTYVDDKTGKTLKVDNLKGVTNAKSGYTTKAAIDTYTGLGYTLVSDDTNGKEVVFDNDDAVDQAFTVHLSHGTITVTPENPGKPGEPVDPDNPDGPKYPDGTDKTGLTDTVNRTITYVMSDGSKAPDAVHDSLSYTASKVIDKVTGEVLETKWSANQDFKDVDSPSVKGYTPDKTVVSNKNIAHDSADITEVVTYNADKQKASVTYVDDKTGKTLKVDNLKGVTNAKSGYTTKAAIDTYTGLGYTLVSDDTNGKEVVFDNDDAVDQAFTVHLSHGTITVTPENPGKPGEPVDPDNPDGPKYPDGTDEYQVKRTGTQTIHYVGAGDKTPADNKQTFVFTREITFDDVTGKIISVTPWNVQSHTFGKVDTPVIPGYHADKAVAGGATVTPDDLNMVIIVTYAPDGGSGDNPGSNGGGDQGTTPTPEPVPEPTPSPDDQPDTTLPSDNNTDKDVEKDKQDKPEEVKKARKIIKTRITKQEHIRNAEKAEHLAEQEHNDQTVASPVKNEANEPQLPQTGEANTSVIGLLGMLVAGFAAILGFESSRSRKHKN